jgi:membrane protein YdbS with pleckstrin-like domain
MEVRIPQPSRFRIDLRVGRQTMVESTMKSIGFRPSRIFLYKVLFQGLLIGFLVIGLTFLLGTWMGGLLLGPSGESLGRHVAITLNLIWMIPSLTLIHPMYRSLFYEIHTDKVVMHSGVITRRVTHVPFRMITNLEIRRGPFDRLFGLGTINIQTASSKDQTSATETLVGLDCYKQIYDQLCSSVNRPQNKEMKESGTSSLFEHEILEILLNEMKKIRSLLEAPEGQK